jgi:hypothetical protein
MNSRAGCRRAFRKSAVDLFGLHAVRKARGIARQETELVKLGAQTELGTADQAAARQKAELEKQQPRAKLLEQFNH